MDLDVAPSHSGGADFAPFVPRSSKLLSSIPPIVSDESEKPIPPEELERIVQRFLGTKGVQNGEGPEIIRNLTGRELRALSADTRTRGLYEQILGLDLDAISQIIPGDEGKNRLLAHAVDLPIRTVRDSAEKVLAPLPSHQVFDLSSAPEDQGEKLPQLLDLMQRHGFEQCDDKKRREEGAIFHYPRTIQELSQRIREAFAFLAFVKNDDGKIMGFIELQNGNEAKAKIRQVEHLDRVLYAFLMRYLSRPDAIVLEQLITADRSLGAKGIGTALFNSARDLARSRGSKLMLTMVQTHPPNNYSQTFHRNRGYQLVGYLPMETTHDGQSVAFELLLLTLTEEAKQELEQMKSASGAASTPTVEEGR